MILRSVIPAFFIVVGTACGSAVPVTWPDFPADSICMPAIPNGVLKLSRKADAKASAQMKALYDADQADRKGSIDSNTLSRDLLRRKKTLELLKSERLSTGTDLLGAAFVFQHGNCPNHYLLAHTLADQAIKRGNMSAKFIFAATYDRWLLSMGKLQKYGTQNPTFAPLTDHSGKLVRCIFIELPIDSATTDSELANYGLPLLNEIKKRNQKIFQGYQNACQNVPKTSQKFYFRG